jgi:hypothetical protein
MFSIESISKSIKCWIINCCKLLYNSLFLILNPNLPCICLPSGASVPFESHRPSVLSVFISFHKVLLKITFPHSVNDADCFVVRLLWSGFPLIQFNNNNNNARMCVPPGGSTRLRGWTNQCRFSLAWLAYAQSTGMTDWRAGIQANGQFRW